MDAFFRGDFEFRNGWRARERMRLVVAWVIGLVLMALALSGAEAEAERAGSPYFAVKGAEAGVDALPLKSTNVDAVLAGPVAEVRVTQVYANEGGVPLEARYVFPGSTRAAVHAMTMTVGGRRIDAVIKEKGEARKTYEAAKKEGRTAALLEAARSNVFEMNVGNILPGDVVTVESYHGRMEGVRVRAFDIARGSVMAYYPEANVLVGTTVDPRSKTPAFKATPVRIIRV